MEMDKILNLDEQELALEGRKAAEQVFRLRFQLRMGQNEAVKKYRELKKDIARIKTVERQRELGIAGAATEPKPKRAAKKAPKAKTGSARAKGAGTKVARKSSKRTSAGSGKAKAGKSSVRAAKRGRANAKKGGS